MLHDLPLFSMQRNSRYSWVRSIKKIMMNHCQNLVWEVYSCIFRYCNSVFWHSSSFSKVLGGFGAFLAKRVDPHVRLPWLPVLRLQRRRWGKCVHRLRALELFAPRSSHDCESKVPHLWVTATGPQKIKRDTISHIQASLGEIFHYPGLSGPFLWVKGI